MDEEEEYSSDTSDEDYVPSDGHVVSEEEGSGEDEELFHEEKEKTGESASADKSKGKRKRTKEKSDFYSRKRKGGIKDSLELTDTMAKESEEGHKEENKDNNEKKKADDLWADFMKDVGQSKPQCVSSGGLGALTKPISANKTSTTTTAKNLQQPSTAAAADGKKVEKITITQEYDFAGEVVKISKEVDANCIEAKEALKQPETNDELKPTAGCSLPVLKKSGGGLGNILGKIGKKQKISTLEKSKLDWNNFKKKEGIEDELQIHNRGKDGYIERMTFLERTDYRQFEIERSLRMSSSSKR